MFALVDGDLRLLAGGLPCSLQRLRLTFEWCNKLGDGGLDALSSALPGTELQLLDLNVRECMRTTARGLAGLLRSLPATTRVLRLCLHSGIDDAGAEVLAESLPPQLEVLRLSFRGCQALSARGSGAIARAGARSDRLRVLGVNLSGCRGLGDPGVEELARHLPQRLEHLSIAIQGCPSVSREGILSLGHAIRERWFAEVDFFSDEGEIHHTQESRRLEQHFAKLALRTGGSRCGTGLSLGAEEKP